MEESRACGVKITPETNHARWGGEPLDLVWIGCRKGFDESLELQTGGIHERKEMNATAVKARVPPGRHCVQSQGNGNANGR